jgi:uncharacterized membrane protein
VFDIIHLIAGDGQWALVAFYLIAAGVLGGLAAAMFGWVDWFAIPAGTRAKRVGLLHGLGNIVVVLLFIVSWALRRGGDPAAPSGTALVLSFVAGGIALVTAWLGGELVDRLGIGVDDGAHPDSPSSLGGKPAGTREIRRPGYTGAERRVGTVPAYAGVERRGARR